MQTWSQIQDYFENLHHQYHNQTSRKMVRLIRTLSRIPDMMLLNRAVGYEAQDLLVWVPHARQIVHVQSGDDEHYVLFLDNESSGTFYGEPLYAGLTDVVPTINQLIRQSLR